MTTEQFLVVIGTIWLAPHSNKWYAFFCGLFFLFIASFKGLGLL